MPFFGFDREMACSRADLARWLTELTGSDHGMAQAGRARIALPEGWVDLITEPVEPRTVGLVRMRRLRVRFVPAAGAEAAARAWVTRFDHHTQRGGG